MTRITYQTDRWGNKEIDHLEVSIGKYGAFITIEDDKIIIHAVEELVIKRDGVNKVTVKVG